MAPTRRKGTGSKISCAASARHQWKPGDLVLAKVKGYPAWPATQNLDASHGDVSLTVSADRGLMVHYKQSQLADVSEPQKWGYSHDWRKVLVYFFGTYQIALCNPSDVEAFTEEKKSSLLVNRRRKGADFVRAVEEIIQMAEKANQKKGGEEVESGDDGTVSDAGNSEMVVPLSCVNNNVRAMSCIERSQGEPDPLVTIDSIVRRKTVDPKIDPDEQLDANTMSEESNLLDISLTPAKNIPFLASRFSRRRWENTSVTPCAMSRSILFARQSRTLSCAEGLEHNKLVDSLVDDDPIGNHLPLCSTELDFDRLNNSSRKLMGKLDHIEVGSTGITDKMLRRSNYDCDKQPIVSCVTYSSTAPMPDEHSSSSRSTMSVKENGTCNTLDSITANEKIKAPDIAEPSETSKLNSIIPDSDKIVEFLSLNHDGQVMTSVFKKKRKPCRKQTTFETTESKLVSPLVSSSNGSPSWLSDTPEKACGQYHVASGDEHLPLVKRARVRMEKPCTDERELGPSSNTATDVTGNLDNVPVVATTSRSDANNIHLDSTVGDKESNNSYFVSTDNGEHKDSHTLLPWRAKRHHLIGSVDAEAALPPSKRLHRALEAMLANVAEAAGTCIELHDRDHHEDVKVQDFVETDVHNHHSPHETKLDIDAFSVAVDPNVADLPKVHICNDDSRGGLPCGSVVRMTSKCTKDVDEKSAVVEHVIHSPLESKPGSMQGTPVDSFCLVQQDAVSLHNMAESTFISDTVLVDNPTLTVGKQHLKAHTSTSNPVEQYQCKNSSVQMVTSASPNKGNGNSSAVMAGDEDGSCTSGSDSGKTTPPYSEGLGLVDTKYVRSKLTLTPKTKGSDLVSDQRPVSDLGVVQYKQNFPRSAPLSNLCSSNSKLDPCETIHHLSSSASEDGRLHPCSEVSGSPNEKLFHALNAEGGLVEQLHGCGTIFLDKVSERSKCSPTLKSFEALLLTLSRTKESIGHATRFSIDCAKYDTANEVVDLLLQRLEIEPSLQRRVDLFFLVDSITQCSHGQKGSTANSYSSAVQAMLPRLLAAAAPPRTVARENRKQCLKVLRLWLKRKTLPESVVQKHIQELEFMNEGSILERRSLRTERALNDPLREMDGMHVDEYGSNRSFHIHGLSIPLLLEEEEELCSSDEKSNRPPISEESCEILEEAKGIAQTTSKKHQHILQAVDGELEMEDVSPSCNTDSTVCNLSRGGHGVSSTDQSDKYGSLRVTQPPLPQEVPPSPPPLPSSPPPSAQPPPTSLPPSLLMPSFVSHCFAEPESCPRESNEQNPLPQQCARQSMRNVGGTNSHGNAHVHPGYTVPRIGMQHCPFGSSGPYAGSNAACVPIQNGSNTQKMSGPQLPNKNLPLRPPASVVSNQFSFLHSELPQRLQSWPCPSLSTYQCQCPPMHPVRRESFKDDGSETRNFSAEMDGGCRFNHSALAASHKIEPRNGHASYHWHQEHSHQYQSATTVGSDNYQNRHDYLSSAQGKVPGVFGNSAPSFWRPT